MKASKLLSTAALAVALLAAQAGILVHGVAQPLGFALRAEAVTAVLRGHVMVPGFSETIEVRGDSVPAS